MKRIALIVFFSQQNHSIPKGNRKVNKKINYMVQPFDDLQFLVESYLRKRYPIEDFGLVLSVMRRHLDSNSFTRRICIVAGRGVRGGQLRLVVGAAHADRSTVIAAAVAAAAATVVVVV